MKKNFKDILNIPLCINSNNNLRNCIFALYIEKDKKYQCQICEEGFYLNESKMCAKEKIISMLNDKLVINNTNNSCMEYYYPLYYFYFTGMKIIKL